MSEVLYPGESGGKDPGFEAVRKKFGPDMVQRIRNWPILAQNFAMAQGYAEDDPAVAAEVGKAERARERCRTDSDHAMAQAEAIARHIPKVEWPVVYTVRQLREQFNSRTDASHDLVEPQGPWLDPAEVTRRFRRLRVGLEKGLHGAELLAFTTTPQPFDTAALGTPTIELLGLLVGQSEGGKA